MKTCLNETTRECCRIRTLWSLVAIKKDKISTRYSSIKVLYASNFAATGQFCLKYCIYRNTCR